MGNPGVRVTLKDASVGAAEAFSRIPGILAVKTTDLGTFVLDCERGHRSPGGGLPGRGRAGLGAPGARPRAGATLEDLFVRLTTHDTAAAAWGLRNRS